MSTKRVILACGLLLALSSLADFAQRAYFHSQPVPAPRSLGSSDINVLTNTPAVSNVWVGTGLTGDTLVAPTSTSRSRLEIANISGATTTSQAAYCNVGDRPATLYSGIVIHASSTKSFSLDDLPRGAVHCRFPVASSSVSVTDY